MLYVSINVGWFSKLVYAGPSHCLLNSRDCAAYLELEIIFCLYFHFYFLCIFVRKGEEHGGDLWVQCNHLVYCKDLPIKTDKPFPFSCPFSKYFSLLTPISILSWREKNKESYAYISSSLPIQISEFYCKPNHFLYKVYCNCYYDANSEDIVF